MISVSASDISLASIGTEAGIPSLNVADIPADIRNGNSQAKQAYSQGLAFESVLVNELSQQMTNAMYGGADSSDGVDSSDSSGGSDGSGGLLGAASAYSSLIPQALTSSIMSGGGVGMADEFAQEIDPALLSGTSQSQSSEIATTGSNGAGEAAV